MKMIKMRNLFILVSALLISINVSARMQERIKASGNYITRNVEVSYFDVIELIGSPDVYYEQTTDGTHSVEVYGSDNLVDLIEANVSGKTLKINMERNVQIDFGKEGQLHVKVSSPDIKAAHLKGSGDISLTSKIQTSELSLKIQGSGDIKVNFPLLINNSLDISMQGSGDITMIDKVLASSCQITLQGSGDIKANQLTANKGKISLQGSGDIEIKQRCAITDLEISLAGSGDLKVYGIESVNLNSSLQGSGDVVLKGDTEEAILTLQNSGDLKADGLKAQNVNACLKGSGELKCHATDHLKAEVKGSGDIRYKGNPKVDANGRKENIRPL